MYSDLPTFFSNAKHILEAFAAWSSAYTPAAKADHICFRCEKSNEFDQVRALFQKDSAFIYQSLISQRRIAVIKFLEPLKSSLGDIWYLELSDQKPDGSQKSGFDHIEIYPIQSTVIDLAADLAQKGFALTKIERPHHTTFDGKMDKFTIRLEPEALIEKIKMTEMK